MFVNGYPYTDFHEMNLDWIINQIKKLTNIIDTFTALQKIKWCGAWDISKAYEQWSIVDTPEHDGYISIKPVPIGVNITNSDYWVKVCSYEVLYASFDSRIKELENKTYGFVTPEMYGAVGDGVTDDIIAIRAAIQSGKPVHFSKSYYISEPITLVNGATLIGDETYDYTINLKTSTGAFIIPDNVRAVTIKGFHCQAQNNSETLLDINATSTRHIHIEGVRADNYNKGIYITGTLWDSTFKNMRIESNTHATDLYVETNHNSFNVMFESVYFSGGGTINVHSFAGTFYNCNFGLFRDSQLTFTDSSNVVFLSCNIECETALSSAIPIRLGGSMFTFMGCSFVYYGDSSSSMIRAASTTNLLKITNCKGTNKVSTNAMTLVPTDYMEMASPGAFQTDNNFINTEYTGYGEAYLPFSPMFAAGIPKGKDTGHYPRSTMRYNTALNEVQYTSDGINWIDALGNANDDSTVIKIGNNKYLEYGQVTVTGDTAQIRFTRKKDGHIFISIPEASTDVIVHTRIDGSDRSSNYCLVKVKEWDDTNKTWKANTQNFKFYWFKISD